VNTENQIPPQPATREKGVQAIPMASTPAVLSAKDTPQIEPASAGRMHADRSVAGPIEGVDPADNLVAVASRHSQGSAPETPADTGPLGDEWLRVETSDFTLTIERPAAATQTRSNDAHAAPQSQTLHHRSSWFDDATLFTHIVVRGDTLWDIAADYLGDPFRYPELANLSRIKDPHWIYPGDRIRIRKKTGPKEAMVKTPRQP
jgi:nucleoid-associated protein YgaU